MKNPQGFHYYIRECENPQCSFRYPVTEITGNEHICPACHGQTRFIKRYPEQAPQSPAPVSRPKISLLLDNIRSVFNVGSIFRSADGCGLVEHIYLCGITPTPNHPKMAKTSLGAEKYIPWSYHLNALVLVKQLIADDCHFLALEATQQSVPLAQFSNELIPNHTILMVGNEVAGLDPDLLSLAKIHIHLPMYGIKESLNVAIAASILLYSLLD